MSTFIEAIPNKNTINLNWIRLIFPFFFFFQVLLYHFRNLFLVVVVVFFLLAYQCSMFNEQMYVYSLCWPNGLFYQTSRYKSNRPNGLNSVSYGKCNTLDFICEIYWFSFRFVSFINRVNSLSCDSIKYFSILVLNAFDDTTPICRMSMTSCTLYNQQPIHKIQLNISTDRNDKLRFFSFRAVVLMELILGDFWHTEDGINDGKN